MSGRQTTIKKRALQAMVLPATASGDLAPAWTGGWSSLWSGGTSDAQLRRLLGSLARRLQQLPPDGEGAVLDAALHAVSARLYGYSEDQAWRSYQWWLERVRKFGSGSGWAVAELDDLLRSAGCSAWVEADGSGWEQDLNSEV